MYKLKNFKSKNKVFLFKLYNQSILEKKFYKNNTISLDEHKNWLKQNLIKRNVIIYIFYYNKKEIGYSRFSKHRKFTYSVSIALIEKYRNKGLGNKLLELSLKNFFRKNKGQVFAYIKNKNSKSINIFKKNNFVKISKKVFYIKTGKNIFLKNFSFLVYKK